uniref:DUF4806 domain-containing protein n=1 Tax=Anopheles maculatus TaxID=74869 RepID=A0A182SX30_9DIPT
MDFSEIMLPSQRDKYSGHIYRLRNKIESKIDREYDAEQASIPIKVESESEDEQGKGMLINTDESLLTSLKMTCSDNEDPFEDCDRTGLPTAQHPEKTVPVPTHELANTSVSNALSVISKQITSMAEKITKIDKKTDRMQKEMENILDRLGRVEKKVGISLATLEQVKDSVVVDEVGSRAENCCQPGFRFTFKKISTEEEFEEFETKLGTDEQYYNNVKKWLLMQLPDIKPNKRMHLALDILMERSFFAQCNWTGYSRNEQKVCFGIRTNIFKLFADIGSNKFVNMTELLVQSFFKKKLTHAKERAKNKSMTSRVTVKRKIAETMLAKNQFT